MATGEQVKSLVKAYIDQDDEKFKTTVLQIAAHEAKLGHDNLARDLKNLTNKMSSNRSKIMKLATNNTMLQFSMPHNKLSDLIVSKDIEEHIYRILNEHRNRRKLRSYGLSNRRKILLEGNPGTGKTLTSSIIASELSLPLYTVQVDKLITKFMGETSVKLRKIFDYISEYNGVYLFDEFDAIGADRSLDNEVGEMRRILNSFLQFIEQDYSDSIIIAATNNQKILDKALFRRFDDVIHYSLPTENEIERLLNYKLVSFDSKFKITKQIVKYAIGLSHAEIVRACDDAIKTSILNNILITEDLIKKLFDERYRIYDIQRG